MFLLSNYSALENVNKHEDEVGYVYLPIEILEKITSYLPTKSLIAFSLTSKTNRVLVLDQIKREKWLVLSRPICKKCTNSSGEALPCRCASRFRILLRIVSGTIHCSCHSYEQDHWREALDQEKHG